MNERNSLPSDETNEVNEEFSQFFGTAQEVVARYTHCGLCGANLHFTHITDFAKNLTQESARCPECAFKVRRIIHKLQ